MRKFVTLTALTLVTLSSFSLATAADEFNTSTGFTTAGAPLALGGVDPVAFVDLGNRLEGSAEFTAKHQNVAYYFDTKANMKKFQKNPNNYIPQHGGFCTLGVAVGKKLDGDPRYADIVDGKLYLFLNEDIFRSYLKDKEGTIAKADKNWVKIKHTAARDL